LQAAIGIAQMKKLSAIIAKKQAIHDRYVQELQSVERFRPVYVDPRSEPVFWFTSFLCEAPDALSLFLRDRNIQTRRFFLPLHQQPCYADRKYIRTTDDHFLISESIYRQGISLPSSYTLAEDDQSYVIEQIRRFYANRD
jgi:perosamine synthetase